MSWNTELPLIAILRGITPQEVADHVQTLLQAGFDAIEIPMNSPDWQQSIGDTVKKFGDRALIGAGTVLQPAQVEELAALGGQLVVTPNTQPAVIRRAVALGMTVCAGCATASEAFNALEAGAQALKIFPSVSFGPDYIKALKAVLPPQIPVFAVGGITPENLHLYLAAGCVGAGLGGDLYRAGQSLERTAQQAAAFVRAYKEATQ
ncbi:2-dehydro-3-deoxy-6-phosphogalactonate aldolase [Serratia quinivorans]|jgi:2-dehydro-3-deoxyphosphogalactonate aldolase|uniref:2-dehydro-3-deoxy-6-phosphogalactonate aldolase n=1 Tax=Serratia quinivorans TaxID=137545 RepID=UPI00217928A5|nr:2-dehydro-3-deoxy-6-phosphogalactonate aldolase [Serratia quinivorans]CAI1906697.1 2-dehydro-3-deoxy-6-phosphogalactonate aldolase [Serratia quinivorans]CAI1929578.1 2-dehydro-3-deoxy-6-phosphogalactonate aldolase [Serratia quinivorans]CAI1982877.1 2-dehydro-3-deoxy-6-phosphogalactonate aldolase [Serratia quinivorans]CAI2140787.1 2-dehydro-3-deoxy-6-phosphogalactonate aldolase [Serratia quinivorans]CAI2148568.1 2-dehydro-3-deoxy-6-phosphogalactonate aldolase [Serratia quinivorans]